MPAPGDRDRHKAPSTIPSLLGERTPRPEGSDKRLTPVPGVRIPLPPPASRLQTAGPHGRAGKRPSFKGLSPNIRSLLPGIGAHGGRSCQIASDFLSWPFRRSSLRKFSESRRVPRQGRGGGRWRRERKSEKAQSARDRVTPPGSRTSFSEPASASGSRCMRGSRVRGHGAGGRRGWLE